MSAVIQGESTSAPPQAGRHLATKPAAYRLVRQRHRDTEPRLDAAQQAVAEHDSGPLLVTAGPGTGKTTTLVAGVISRIAAGVPPEKILVLTYGRRAANQLRERIVARLGRTTIEPSVRTFHAYAFAILRRVAGDLGRPPPRLLTGPEQDLVIRDLIAGDMAGQGVRWPDRLYPALPTRGFAKELRDLLLRAYERGVDAATLAKWGERHDREDWLAAAQFMKQYAEVTELRNASMAQARAGGAVYDPAELIRAAVAAFHGDSELLAAERAERSCVFVDEYQDTDPAQQELLRLLCEGGRFLVAFGDSDQSVFTFRGGDPDGLRRFSEDFRISAHTPAPVTHLYTSYRGGGELAQATGRIVGRLRGLARHRIHNFASDSGSVRVHVVPSAAQEATLIAHRLRVANVLGGVSWARMAVIVRSGAHQLATIRRALRNANIPVREPDETPLAQQPVAMSLLLLVRCALQPQLLNAETAVALVCSPLGGADALTLRKLRAQLRGLAGLRASAGESQTSTQLLADALRDPQSVALVAAPWAQPAQRIVRLLAAVRSAAQRGGGAHAVLWAAWAAAGLAEPWRDLSRSGGRRGAAADRDLDAVIALMQAAEQFGERMPGAGPLVFVEQLLGQQIRADSLAPTGDAGAAVSVLTAHSAKGREFDVVCVAGVNEGVWPDLRLRGGLLGAPDLVELAAGREPGGADHLAVTLDEERRLFYLAVTRARKTLMVTAVDGDDTVPSRFLDELVPPAVPGEARPHTVVPRPISLAGLVAELRMVVANREDPRRLVAAAQLAELARQRVPGAHPDSWWGIGELSDEGPLQAQGELVTVSPSHVEKFVACELRWLLEKCGGAAPASAAQGVGVAVHEVAAFAARRAAAGDPPHRDELLRQLDAELVRVDFGTGWFARRSRERAVAMVNKLANWLAKVSREVVAAEQDFRVRVGDRVVLQGRADRVEVDDAGRVVVVDLKTGKSQPSKAEAAKNPQLAAYQVAVDAGGFSAEDGRQFTESGGAMLVQLGTTAKSASEQHQPPPAGTVDPHWARRLITETGEGMAGARFTARVNKYCEQCAVRTCCPLNSEQLTQ